MLVEGKGIIAPAPVRITISTSVLARLRDVAEDRDRRRGYAARRDAWGRGFVKNPTLVGLVGEAAICEYVSTRGFRQSVDYHWRPFGDGGRDLVVEHLIIQVKTRRKNVSGCSLIRRGQRGRIVPLACDLFVFVQWSEDAPEGAYLLGWQWAMFILRHAGFARSPLATADHWNLNVPDPFLQPMNRLIDEFRGRVGVTP